MTATFPDGSYCWNTTDPAGRFWLPAKEEAVAVLTVKHRAYATTTRADVVVPRRGGISGLVTDEMGAAVWRSNLVLGSVDPDKEWFKGVDLDRAKNTPARSYEIPRVEAGAYRLYAFGHGYRRGMPHGSSHVFQKSEPFEVADEATTTVNLVLRRAPRLVGRVTDSRGRPSTS